MNAWTLVILGCGTVGFWVTQALTRSPAANRLMRLVLCDRGRIRKHNAITCPSYAGHIGRLKCERLAELVSPRLKDTPVQVIAGYVEQLDWSSIVSCEPSIEHKTTFVLVGLDVWQSRLAVAEDLRHYAETSGDAAVMIQVGLDKGQAQICVFASRWEDPCPACGKLTLPEPQPCVVFSAGQELLRGNLCREGQAAARWVRRMVEDELRSTTAGHWMNTKTNLVLDRHSRLSRACRRVEGCRGPHARATPLRWDTFLQPLERKEQHP